ncbi:MAG: hypothetical protein HYZ42_14580 [Bacteroidetes bacterium]|nr:hypothetical protein [Bacteroidota bacterium]
MDVKHGSTYNSKAEATISEMKFTCVNGDEFTVMINDFITAPARRCSFYVAEDFLLQKKLKATFGDCKTDYRVFESSPILLLIFLTLLTSSVGYLFNLNQNSHSLTAMCFVNALILLAIVCI